MGCCFSSPSPYQNQTQNNQPPSSSSQAINGSQPQLNRPSTNASNRSNIQNRSTLAGSATPSHTTPNPTATTAHVSLKPPKPWETKRNQKKWTRETLDRAREEFFHTRTSARRDRWQIIRFALEEVWAGGPDANGRFDKDRLATADAILSGGDIVLKNGDLSQMIYDKRGDPYPLEIHIISDPKNLDTSPATNNQGNEEDEDKGDNVGDKEDEESEEVDEAELLKKRLEKGKGVATTDERTNVTLRFSEGQRDRRYSIGKHELVGNLIYRVSQDMGVEVIRLMMLGKQLQQGKSLHDQGWDAQMLNAFVMRKEST